MRHDPGAAMPGTDDIDHVQIIVFDQAIEVDVEHVQPRRRAPMAEQTRLDMRHGERLGEQRVLPQIDLAHRQVVRGTPIGVHLSEQFGRQRVTRPCGGND
jgi:hypothetical protein